MNSSAPVFNLLVRCPTTGLEADTGFSMNAEKLAGATLVGNAFECGHCGEFHAWSKADLIPSE
jgi:hypothetical protein